MSRRAISFYSEGVKLQGDLFFPDGAGADDRRAGIVLCHGYTGVKDLFLPDNAEWLRQAGYAVLIFDYKGWGESEGARHRLAPFSRVADSHAALNFLAAQKAVDDNRLGLYGTSYGGATVIWAAALDARVGCVVSVVGVGQGEKWMRSVRRPDEWIDLLERSAADRTRRALTGESEIIERDEILLQDRASAELSAEARRANPAAINTLPLEFVDETLSFHADWVVDKIAPRPLLLITTDDDRLVPPEQSENLFALAGEPKKLVTLNGYGHYDVYTEPAFSEVMAETGAWFATHLPARG
ncbi:MAG: alpha/beta hydrolase [Proteobacteria bacterium]|nr:alpha/beta hydrolase [Pseudomonadota bacterium]MDA1357270.1 alpha/beta hydrolase [Pseudomonadota bacterium]